LCLLYDLFILAGRSSAAVEVNGKDKGRILNKDKDNVANGKGNIAEIEFKNLLTNSISRTVGLDYSPLLKLIIPIHNECRLSDLLYLLKQFIR